jgi:putative SbcD/Mre11-related phosphoesterase
MNPGLQVHHEWLLTPQRVAVHLPTATAVAADLHLGYDQARIRAGDAVPVSSLEEQLVHLSNVFSFFGIHRLVVAGDLVEDARCIEVIPQFLKWLRPARADLIGLIPGNHDKGLMVSGLPLCNAGLCLGSWQVVHGDAHSPPGKVVHGHVHPAFRWSSRAPAPCYLVGPNRLILPAFSREAAGSDVACDPRWRAYRCCVIAGHQVLDLGMLRDLPKQGKPQASDQRGVRVRPRLAARRREAYQ